MNAMLIALALCGQYHHHARHVRDYRHHQIVFYGSWFYMPMTMQSPWNQAVAELRVYRDARPRGLPSETVAAIQCLLAEKRQLWATLIEASPADKPSVREEYLKTKIKLEFLQTEAAKELWRRRQ